MLSTHLIETLYSYGRIESPYEEESVRAEIEEIIGGTVGARASERAYGIVSSQFEEVVGEPYFTAIEALSEDQRVKLYTIAALGAPAHGFWNDWLLAELVKAADRTALPAFEYWATNLNLDGFYAQGSTACYMLAVQGCALFLDEPPKVAYCRTDDQAAWQCYGAIIFWMYRPQIEAEETLARCAPYWQRLTGELLPAAADPLCQFLRSHRSYDQEGGPVISRIMKVFPRHLCHVLEWGLEHHDSLTSIFPGPGRESRTADIIHMLSYVGNADTIELLRAYTDDKTLGRDAIKAIKTLQART